ncbi:MAG: hypothetical protein GY722_29000 [bacterium]|nr:hypothetical protein [bacterium]
MRLHFLSARVVLATILIGVSASATQAQTSVLGTAAEIGITPESLVLADVEQHAPAILASISAASNERLALVAAHQAVDSASQNMAQVASQLQAGSDEDGLADLIAARVAAEAELLQRRTELQALRDTIRTAVTSGLPPAAVICINTSRQAAAYRVPTEFRVLQRTPEQWKAIERAVREEKKAMKRGVPLAQQYAGLLTAIRSDPQVAGAEQRLVLHLSAVRQIFQNYTSIP